VPALADRVLESKPSVLGAPGPIVLAAMQPTSALPQAVPAVSYAPAASPATTARTPTQPARHARARTDKPSPSGRADADRTPQLPADPPGRGAIASGVSAPGGGASAAMWCAMLVGFLLYARTELRRHRVQPALSGPSGVPSPHQRPG
jgi:hypothetical protein